MARKSELHLISWGLSRKWLGMTVDSRPHFVKSAGTHTLCGIVVPLYKFPRCNPMDTVATLDEAPSNLCQNCKYIWKRLEE